MLDGEEAEAVHRAAELAGQLAILARTAAPMLDELAELLGRIGTRTPLKLVEARVQPVELVGQGGDCVDEPG